MKFVSWNGHLVPEAQPLFTAGNPSFKWGEGIFETIRVHKGSIPLWHLHAERLWSGLSLLGIEQGDMSKASLEMEILKLCRFNRCDGAARVRLSLFRGNEGGPAYAIEAMPLPETLANWHDEGWKIGLYKDAVKSFDSFSHLKTASYLPYALAARYAAVAGLDEVLLLNPNGGICDGSKTNIFILSEGTIITPGLDQGCIGGVMRRWLTEKLPSMNYLVLEQPLDQETLAGADEIFLTNALVGLRWVSRFEGRHYGFRHSRLIYDKISSTIWR
ncbi:MAG TPA: aminotransferase class IV [Flavisolibacter sp.]|nr:aminotransferase class IV [Flavisolibacter sp.]